MSNPLVINIYKTLDDFDGVDDIDSAICSVYYHWDADVSCTMKDAQELIEAIGDSIEDKDVIKSIIDNTNIRFGCTESQEEEERSLFLKKYGISFDYKKEECNRTEGLLYFSNKGKHESFDFAVSAAQVFLKDKIVNFDACCWPSDNNEPLGDISFHMLELMVNTNSK